MENSMPADQPECTTEQTPSGVWRRFKLRDGKIVFEEYKSSMEFAGWPLLHVTKGISPETGRRVVAKGVIAIGRKALGVVAIGQFSAGLITIGQFAPALLFGIGQFSTGAIVIGQFALGGVFALGQFAAAYVAIGQFAVGHYALGQFGLGTHVWDMRGASPAAQQFFRSFIP